MSEKAEQPIDRIIWLTDGPHVVEKVHEAEYATILTVARERATPDQLIEWRSRP